MNRNFTGITAVLAVVLVAGAMAYGLYRLAGRQDTSGGEGSMAEKESLRDELRKLSLQVEALSTGLSTNERMVGNAGGKMDPQAGQHTDINTLALQVATLSRDMDALQDQVLFLAGRLSTGSVKPEPKETAATATATEPDSAGRESLYSRLNKRYQSEIRDDQWAKGVEMAIAEEFTTSPDVAGISIDAIDCRTSLCRVVWQYPKDATNEEAFVLENEMAAAMSRAGFNASTQQGMGGGLNEGYFYYQPPPAEDMRNRRE